MKEKEVSNKKDRINKKIKNQKEKCEVCGYEGKAGEFIIEDINPWEIKSNGYITVCKTCKLIMNNYLKKINEIIEKNKEE